MNPEITAEELRAIFLAAGEADSTQWMALTVSISLFIVVLWLVRRRSLQEEYTPIWMGVAFALLVISVRIDILWAITHAVGAWTTSSTVFFLGEFFLVAICLNYAVRLSRANIRLKNLAQDLALLRAQVDKLETRVGT
jgi:hypothetical protein